MTNPQTDTMSQVEKEFADLVGIEQTPKKQRQKPKKKRHTKKVILIILLILLVLLLAAGGIFAWMYHQGQKDLLTTEPPAIEPPKELIDSSDGDRVVYKGVTYEYNYDVTAILVAGVDKKDIQEESIYGQNGQADTLFLATLDTKTGEMHIIPISRETMVDVDRYSADGSYIGVEKTQLCLAYAYGSTGEEGSENVVRSVSRLLYGVPINSYVAIDLDGVKEITNAIGGIPITGLEDVSDPWDGKIIVRKGEEVTLTGRQALIYMRHRDTDAQANNRRMQRLKQFFTAFIAKSGETLKEDIGLLPKYYNIASPYIVTDVTLSKMTYLASCTLSGNNWKSPNYHSISGRSIDGEKHAEFYPTSSSVYEAVLAAYYKPVAEQTTSDSTTTDQGTSAADQSGSTTDQAEETTAETQQTEAE